MLVCPGEGVAAVMDDCTDKHAVKKGKKGEKYCKKKAVKKQKCDKKKKVRKRCKKSCNLC